MSSTTCAIQAWDAGGVAPVSSVSVMCIPRQCWVSGWLGNSFLHGDQDGEWEGNAPISSRSLWPLDGMGVWPSVHRLAPDIWSSKLLDLVAIDATVVAMNWNFRSVHAIQVQRPLQEIKNHWVCTNCVFSTVTGIVFICHQQAPSQMWGWFQLGKR